MRKYFFYIDVQNIKKTLPKQGLTLKLLLMKNAILQAFIQFLIRIC